MLVLRGLISAIGGVANGVNVLGAISWCRVKEKKDKNLFSFIVWDRSVFGHVV